jgi:putrescine aminotransferase
MSVKKVKELYPSFLTLDDALALDRETATALQLKHNNKNRTELALQLSASGVIAKAEGCYLWDTDGNKHLDFVGSVGVYTLGINNPFLNDSIRKYLDTKPLTMDPLMIHQTTAAFSHNMALITPGMTRTVVCGGGGMEANETALKMVKIAAYRNKTGKKRILGTLNAFHGKSTACVNIAGKPKWRQWQGEDLPNFAWVPYGDLAAIEAELAKGDVIAFFAETIQGEGGIVVPPEDYFPAVRKLCDKYDTYLVLDEIQAGCCRTGHIWAWQHYEGFQPDAFTFAKGISGGVLPLGGCQATEELYMAAYGSNESCFHHTATYQDNQISGALALSALQFMLENNVAEHIRYEGAFLHGRLNELKEKYPNIIKEIRGRGYMIGVKFGANANGEGYAVPVCATLAGKHRVHTMFSTNDDTICRVFPNFTTTREDMEWFLDAFEDAIKDVFLR